MSTRRPPRRLGAGAARVGLGANGSSAPPLNVEVPRARPPSSDGPGIESPSATFRRRSEQRSALRSSLSPHKRSPSREAARDAGSAVALFAFDDSSFDVAAANAPVALPLSTEPTAGSAAAGRPTTTSPVRLSLRAPPAPPVLPAPGEVGRLSSTRGLRRSSARSPAGAASGLYSSPPPDLPLRRSYVAAAAAAGSPTSPLVAEVAARSAARRGSSSAATATRARGASPRAPPAAAAGTSAHALASGNRRLTGITRDAASPTRASTLRSPSDASGLGVRLCAAARTCNAASVEALLARGAPASFRSAFARGRGPLHEAALHGGAAVVPLLVRGGADPNAQDDAGATPLHCAARVADVEATEALCRAGADVNAVDNEGDTPLDACVAAAREGAAEAFSDTMLVLLQHHASWEVISRALHEHVGDDDGVGGATRGAMLLAAAEEGLVESVVDLARRDPDALEWRDCNGFAVLHAAVAENQPACVEALLRCGADPNARGAHGYTPLSSVAEGDHHACVRPLLEAGADLHLLDDFGSTALHWCAHFGAVHSIRELLAADADACSEMMLLPDSKGLTALDYARRARRYHVLGVLKQHLAQQKLHRWALAADGSSLLRTLHATHGGGGGGNAATTHKAGEADRRGSRLSTAAPRPHGD